MLIADLIPFVVHAKDSNSNLTGQSFITYGKVVNVKFDRKKKKKPISASILEVHDVQTYLAEIGLNNKVPFSFAHKITEHKIEELPPEFILELRHKKIIG